MNKVLISVIVLLFCVIVSAYAVPIPDTGQTKCYDNAVEITCPSLGAPFYGQDAQYTISQHSYTDLGNGVVRDNVTGLEWEVKSNKDGMPDSLNPNDADNSYTWYDGSSGTPGSGTNTQDFINDLNAANYGGNNDWRLPTIKELSTLVDCNIPDPGPVIDENFFPGTQNKYWSSNTLVGTSAAYYVYFNNGYVNAEATSFTNSVRAVRSGSPLINNFINNEDGTVTDKDSGLMWQQATAPGTYTWESALAYCEDLILNNDGEWTIGIPNASGIKYDNWRLPTRNELQSIVDYSISSPAIDSVFLGTIPDHYWSSTTNALDTNQAWTVHFLYGHVNYGYIKTGSNYVRAVRGGQYDYWCCQCYFWDDVMFELVPQGCADNYSLVNDIGITCHEFCEMCGSFDEVKILENCFCPAWDLLSWDWEYPDSCEENCTLVELSSFKAVAENREVRLIWSTASEIDNAGFNIFRAKGDGEYEQINDSLIPAEGSPTEGIVYGFVDDDVENRITYSYMLEDIDINGVTTQHGPVSATPRLILGD